MAQMSMGYSGYRRPPPLTIVAAEAASRGVGLVARGVGSLMREALKAIKPKGLMERWGEANATSRTVGADGTVRWKYDPREAAKAKREAEANKPMTHEEKLAAHDRAVRERIAQFEAMTARNQDKANAALGRLSPENQKALRDMSQRENLRAAQYAERSGNPAAAQHFKEQARDIAAGRLSNSEVADRLDAARDANDNYQQQQRAEQRYSAQHSKDGRNPDSWAAANKPLNDSLSLSQRTQDAPAARAAASVDKRSDAAWSFSKGAGAEQSRSESGGGRSR